MQDYAHSSKRKSIADSFLRIFTFIMTTSLLLLVVVLILVKSTTKESVTIISPLAGPIEETLSAIDSFIFSRQLSEIISQTLKNEPGMYGIVIKNMTTNEIYKQNESEKFASASLYKLWLMGTAYEQMSEGKLKSSDIISNSIPRLNTVFNISSDAAELSEGEISLSVQEAIEKSITISDNYSALLLTTKVKVSNMKKFLQEHGMQATTTGGTPITTPTDITTLFELLYERSLVSKEADESMVQTLLRQQLGDRIPKYLPKELQIAHKTGELDGYKHDAGIIFTPKGDYIFVVLTKTNDPKRAAEVIAKISEKVYTYFTN